MAERADLPIPAGERLIDIATCRELVSLGRMRVIRNLFSTSYVATDLGLLALRCCPIGDV